MTSWSSPAPVAELAGGSSSAGGCSVPSQGHRESCVRMAPFSRARSLLRHDGVPLGSSGCDCMYFQRIPVDLVVHEHCLTGKGSPSWKPGGGGSPQRREWAHLSRLRADGGARGAAQGPWE